MDLGNWFMNSHGILFSCFLFILLAINHKEKLYREAQDSLISSIRSTNSDLTNSNNYHTHHSKQLSERLLTLSLEVEAIKLENRGLKERNKSLEDMLKSLISQLNRKQDESVLKDTTMALIGVPKTDSTSEEKKVEGSY